MCGTREKAVSPAKAGVRRVDALKILVWVPASAEDDVSCCLVTKVSIEGRGRQVGHARDQVGVGFFFELVFFVRAGQYADDMARAGIVARLHVEHGVADAHDLVHAGDTGRFHRAEDTVRPSIPQSER